MGDLKCHHCGTPVIRGAGGRSGREAADAIKATASRKRKRRPWPREDRDNLLAMRWNWDTDNDGPDVEYWSPNRPDGHLLHGMFGGFMDFCDFVIELTRRGYDLATLRFEVRRFPRPATSRPPTAVQPDQEEST